MKTAAFANYTGPGRISIARFPPRGTPAGFRIFRPLAPGPWFNAVDEAEYRTLYFHHLNLLDPFAVVAKLADLAAGAEPILMCYERPPFTSTNFCHRHMVAEWLKTEIGLVVDEL